MFQVVNRLAASCELHAGLMQVVSSTCSKSANIKLATCNRLVIIKPEHAMRTHPDIGLVIADLVIADLLQLARFWLCR